MKQVREYQYIRLSIVLGVLISFAPATASEKVTVRFEDIPSLVKKGNRNVTGAKTLTAAAEVRTGHLVRSFLPEVSVTAGGEQYQSGHFSQRSDPYGSVEAKVNLFRGGRDRYEEEVRKGQAELSRGLEHRSYVSEVSEARKHFWNLVAIRETLTILRNAATANERNLASANKRISRGLTGTTDRIEFEINSSEIKVDIESLLHEEQILAIKLAGVIGMDLGTQFEVPNLVPHEHHEDELKATLNTSTHPEFRYLDAQKTIADMNAHSQKRWWMPSVEAYTAYSLYTLREREYLSRNDRNEAVVGVRLHLTLFDGLHSQKEANAFATQAQGYEEQAAQRSRMLETDLRVAQEEMKHDHELIHEAEKRIEQGRTYLSSTLSEYERGVKNSPDVLGALQRYVSFQRRYIDLKHDYQLSRIKLLAVMPE